MKWFSAIECSNTTKNPLITDSGYIGSYEYWDFERGRSIHNWDEDFWLKAKKIRNDGDPDDALQNYLGLPIYSLRLQTAINKAGIQGIQFLPVQILRPDDSKLEGFAIANILNLVPALDMELSDYDVFPDDHFIDWKRGQIRGLRKGVLKGNIISGLDIIRLEEYSGYIYVLEKFKDLFESNGFTEYSFHECRVV